MSDTLEVRIETNVYALSEHGHDTLPYPMPADTWLWQHGDRWVAHVGMWHVEDWWEGADDEDIAARPDNWARHILDVPTTGTLVYLDAEGTEHTVFATPKSPDPRFDSFTDDELAALAQGMIDLASAPGHLAVTADKLHDAVQAAIEDRTGDPS